MTTTEKALWMALGAVVASIITLCHPYGVDEDTRQRVIDRLKRLQADIVKATGME